MEIAQNILRVIIESALLTLQVSLLFFGGIFVIGLLLYLLAGFTRNLFAKTFCSRAEIYITAWVGTPVHELGHTVFCILFLHKIRKVTLFNPNSKDGTLGAVEHSYNPRNVYQRIGNFFIGAGPLFFGSLVIFLLSRWLLPRGIWFQQFADPDSFLSGADASKWYLSFVHIFHQIGNVLNMLFSTANAGTWQFWLFLYLSLAISSHMELSPPDIKQMWSGLFVILLLIFMFNMLYLAFFASFENILFRAVSFFSSLSQLLMVGLVFSVINFLITWMITALYGFLFHQKIPNPFTR